MSFIVVFILVCIFTYFGIRVQYMKDVPLTMSSFWNPLGPVEYTIKEVDDFPNNSVKPSKYYKIYWNLYPFLKKIGINLAETSDKIVYIGNDCESIPNYFKTVQSAITFIKSDRATYNFTINTEIE